MKANWFVRKKRFCPFPSMAISVKPRINHVANDCVVAVNQLWMLSIPLICFLRREFSYVQIALETAETSIYSQNKLYDYSVLYWCAWGSWDGVECLENVTDSMTDRNSPWSGTWKHKQRSSSPQRNVTHLMIFGASDVYSGCHCPASDVTKLFSFHFLAHLLFTFAINFF